MPEISCILRGECTAALRLAGLDQGPIALAPVALHATAGAGAARPHRHSIKERNMRKILVASAALAVLAFPLAASSQEKAALAVSQQEAIVKVVKIDRKTRQVTFQGPRGRQVTMTVP